MTKTPTTIFQNNDEAIEILGYCNPITINIDLKTRKLTYTNDCVRTWIPLFAVVNDVLDVAVNIRINTLIINIIFNANTVLTHYCTSH